MHILVTVYGSAGDVHPMLGLALALKSRGHRITFATSEYFSDLVDRVGIEFAELGTREEFLEAIQNPDLWHPRRGPTYVIREGVGRGLRDEYQLVRERYVPGETVAITSCLGFGTRVAHEKLGVPLVTVHGQPAVLWSDYDSPRYAGMLSGPAVPRWLKRAQIWAAQKLFIGPAARPSLNAFRAELGLPPVHHVMNWWHTADRVIGLFPEWYAPRQPDWPSNVVLTQFPLWDERDVTQTPPEIEEFLERSGPPIVFTPGSGMVQGSEFFRAAVEACRRLGQPGMLLTRFPEQIPAELPENVRHFEYVPFSAILPRAAAVVHHGGIGSTSQGLRAGIPQLLMPMSHDQPDNAARIKRLGVGDWLRPSAFRGPRVAEKVERLIASMRSNGHAKKWRRGLSVPTLSGRRAQSSRPSPEGNAASPNSRQPLSDPLDDRPR